MPAANTTTAVSRSGMASLGDRRCGAPRIDWDSARVESVGNSYELKVEVEGATPEFEDAFHHQVTVRRLEKRRDPWGVVSVLGDEIVVQEVRPVASRR